MSKTQARDTASTERLSTPTPTPTSTQMSAPASTVEPIGFQASSAVAQTELIVALDVSAPEAAYALVQELRGLPVIFKVGFELFLAGGPPLVHRLVQDHGRVFLDLKFHDIPNTVAKAARQAASWGVEMLTVHLSGGETMVRRAIEEIRTQSGPKPKVLGVSVLTSFDDQSWNDVACALTGCSTTVVESVVRLVERAIRWGVDGVVCSAMELPAVRRLSSELYAVVPGIRPAGIAAGDQARVMTPRQARAQNASAIVVGRPIVQSPAPRRVVEEILGEIA